MGVVEGGCCGGDAEVAELAELAGFVDDGRKEIERVPENRTIDTASATGRIAVSGLG